MRYSIMLPLLEKIFHDILAELIAGVLIGILALVFKTQLIAYTYRLYYWLTDYPIPVKLTFTISINEKFRDFREIAEKLEKLGLEIEFANETSAKLVSKNLNALISVTIIEGPNKFLFENSNKLLIKERPYALNISSITEIYINYRDYFRFNTFIDISQKIASICLQRHASNKYLLLEYIKIPPEKNEYTTVLKDEKLGIEIRENNEKIEIVAYTISNAWLAFTKKFTEYKARLFSLQNLL